MADQIESIDLHRIYLDQRNPRHEILVSEAEVIQYLCSNEQIIELAKDIVLNGLNPLEIFAVIIDRTSDSDRDTVYIAAEGNRRLCAVKLLNDPDLAPSDVRREFVSLSKLWEPLEEVSAIVFPDREAVKLWLDRIHGGQQNGIGRKSWNAEQKERFSGGDRNKIALHILDFAEKNGIITPDDRKKKLTTAQRFLSNVLFREELGVIVDKSNNIYINRPIDDFKIVLKQFVCDLIDGEIVNSRATKPTIDNYARNLRTADGLSPAKTEPVSLEELAKANKDNKTEKRKTPSPSKPERAKHIPSDEAIAAKLGDLGNQKLASLYYSICKIPLAEHTPLIVIGVWAFWECVSALMGRHERIAFPDYFTTARLVDEYKIGTKDRMRPLTQALTRISQNSNATKHHLVSADYNDQQLVNDMTTLKPLMIYCIDRLSEVEKAKK